jgi:hypothetical protein
VEHVTPDVAASIYAELRRLIQPRGAIVITTPACEDLAMAANYCPFCDSEFHMWQHLRSLSPASLRDELTAAGLDVRWCTAIDLEAFDPQATLTRVSRARRLVSWSWRQALAGLRMVAPDRARRLEFWLRELPGGKLIAVAHRRDASSQSGPLP